VCGAPFLIVMLLIGLRPSLRHIRARSWCMLTCAAHPHPQRMHSRGVHSGHMQACPALCICVQIPVSVAPLEMAQAITCNAQQPTNDHAVKQLHSCKLVTALVLTSHVPCIPTHLRAHPLSAQSVTAFSERPRVDNELVRHGSVHRGHGWHSQECAAANEHVGCVGVLCDCHGHRRECCWVLLNAVAETRVQRPCIGQR
jgi:hypothetical protein